LTFRDAVKATGLERAYCDGLQALSKSDRARLAVHQNVKLTGSIDLDAALHETHPNDPRWDYAIARRPPNGEFIHWVEVHPATDAEIKTVLAKFEWLQGWLRTQGKALMNFESEFIWISSGKTAFSPVSHQRRKMSEHGLRHVGSTLRLTP
jgi:hypothetical protein